MVAWKSKYVCFALSPQTIWRDLFQNDKWSCFGLNKDEQLHNLNAAKSVLKASKKVSRVFLNFGIHLPYEWYFRVNIKHPVWLYVILYSLV